MKFVKKIDDIGKAFVYLDLEGIKVQGQPSLIESLCTFDIYTYKLFRANEQDVAWEQVFGPVHLFLDTLTNEEKKSFAETMLAMHYRIQEWATSSESSYNKEENILSHREGIYTVKEQLSNDLAAFNQKIRLLDRLRDFVIKNLPIPVINNPGGRAQDTKEMTFLRDDFIELTCIVLVCKMFSPVIGIFLESCKKFMANNLKEPHGVAILNGILKERQELIDKLMHFIHQLIHPFIKDPDQSHLFRGYTINTLLDQIYAAILVRRLICVDLFYKDGNGNLLTYITSCTRSAAQTATTHGATKTAVRTLRYPNEREGSGDEGNLSTLETESRKSSSTIDVPILVRSFARRMIPSFCLQYEIDIPLLDAATAYHTTNPVIMTPINTFIMCSALGGYLGGASSIHMLTAEMCNRIVPMLQLHLIDLGLINLAVAMTIVPTDGSKTIPTHEDNQLKVAWKSSYDYRNCQKRFVVNVGNLTWDTKIEHIVDELTKRFWVHQTSPAIWNKLGSEYLTGKTYQTSEKIAQEICGYLLSCV